MPITPEEAQKLSDLQRRILANAAAGKPTTDGLTQDEVRDALNFVRKDRSHALQAGIEKKPRTKKAAAPKNPGAPLDLSKFAPGVSLD